jgi:AcrR family transcriptional regulator
MEPDARKAQLLEAGYEIARKKGITKVTRAAIARACKVSDGLLNRYFEGREGLRLEVMEFAVSKKDAATLAACSTHYELPAMPRDLDRAVKAALQ